MMGITNPQLNASTFGNADERGGQSLYLGNDIAVGTGVHHNRNAVTER